MNIEIKVPSIVEVTHLKVKCGARYWEDGTVNDIVDSDGSLIPLRDGDYWCPIINLETGIINDWPIGTTADVHYKCCDDGEYWLTNKDGFELASKGYYVPSILDITRKGYGDYVILNIDEDGKIKNWPKEHNIKDFLIEEED